VKWEAVPSLDFVPHIALSCATERLRSKKSQRPSKSKKPSDLLDGFFLRGRRQPLIHAAAHFSAVRTRWGLILCRDVVELSWRLSPCGCGPEREFFDKSCLGSKIRFVCGPGFRLGSPALLTFLLFTCNLALGSFLLVQSDRFDNSCRS